MDIFEKATQQFLHVGTQEPKPLPSDVTTTSIQIATPPQGQEQSDMTVKVHCQGKGPAALLVHGWRSQAANLQNLSTLLVDSGFQVWMPDLPGHGHSEGERLSMPLAADVLHAVQKISGPFSMAVGHSYGGASLVHAIAGGLDVKRVALLAAPTHYGKFARLSASQAGLPKDMVDAWLLYLEKEIGCHPDEIDMKRQAQTLSMPALLAHSNDDPVAPFDQLREVASIWRGAKWLPLEGLGHFRLLSDPALLSELKQFVRQH